MTEQDKNTYEAVGKIPIHAYLSYRQIRGNEAYIELLGKHCVDQNITLVCDKQALKEGESIIAFMDELASARCVFLFLTPAYFQSAYTLYELVTIKEWADLDKRFIHPIRVSEDMSVYQWTEAETYWHEDEAIRDVLTRLLKTTDHEAVWQRVKAAWENIIFPFLNRVHPSLESSNIDNILRERVMAARNAMIAAIKEEESMLHSKVKSEIIGILNSGFIPLDDLADEMGLDKGVNAENITKHWIEKSDIEDALIKLTSVLVKRKEKLKTKPEEWDNCYLDAERLCGWLLINSVDPIWWFNHQLKMNQDTRKSVGTKYSSMYPPYVEVIISRSVLKYAQYKLNAKAQAQPVNDYHNVMLFDSISRDATDTQLLMASYKDLFRSTDCSDDLNELIKWIKIHAKYIYRKEGKPLYYLVEQQTMELLESRDWFKELAGHIQFVSCGLAPKNDDFEPCNNQEFLLHCLSRLLLLRKPE